MPAPLDEALHRTSLNLFYDDVLELERRHGRGWTEIVRNLVREHVRSTTTVTTLGDMVNDTDEA